MGVDVAPARRVFLQLLAQLSDEDVDRAVAVSHRIAPDALIDLLALEHLAARLHEQLQQLELTPREVEALPAAPTNGGNGPGAPPPPPRHQRPALAAHDGAAAPADDGLHPRDDLLRVA